MKKKFLEKLRERKGFTLIEMIIVIAIIAILIALIAPNLQKFLKTSKQTKADAAAKTLYTSMSTYLVEQYTKEKTVSNAGATWTRADIETNAPGFMKDYFNEEEISDSVTFKITFDAEGNVATTEWNADNGITGHYPKQDTDKKTDTE